MDSLASLLIPLAAGQVTIIGFVWGFAWWLSRKFSSIYDRIQKTLDLMITKLEYHEEHDDKRFSQITDNLWALRVEQAVVKASKQDDEKR